MTYLYPIQEEKLIIPENNECSELYQIKKVSGSRQK